MTKLTTEITIEELQYRIHAHENDLTQMWTADYFLSVQKELLALKQAAKNPVAWIVHMRTGDQFTTDSDFVGLGESTHGIHSTPLYAEPVLPKQPESIVCYALMHTQTGDVYNTHSSLENAEMYLKLIHQSDDSLTLRVAPLCVATTAQPVIPEGLIKEINRLLDNDGSRGCFDALEQHRAKTELERLLAAAQQMDRAASTERGIE
ncbi:hypothetical protein VU677_18900 [Hafnia paralvei]|uniref:hypothetical protein n=1 Tax=Hafnia paralvei TaxID=546367 RepID=UPI00300DA1C6